MRVRNKNSFLFLSNLDVFAPQTGASCKQIKTFNSYSSNDNHVLFVQLFSNKSKIIIFKNYSEFFRKLIHQNLPSNFLFIIQFGRFWSSNGCKQIIERNLLIKIDLFSHFFGNLQVTRKKRLFHLLTITLFSHFALHDFVCGVA